MLTFLFETGIGIRGVADGRAFIDLAKVKMTLRPDDDIPVPRIGEKVKLPFGGQLFVESVVSKVPVYDYSAEYGCCVNISVGIPDDFTFESVEALRNFLEEEGEDYDWEIIE